MHKVELEGKNSRSKILVDGVEIGCIDGSGRGSSMVYILVSKDLTQPFDYWRNAMPIARWKYGKGKAAGARAWVNCVLGQLDLVDALERLKTTAPATLMEHLSY